METQIETILGGEGRLVHGQATLEYVVCLAAFMALLAALVALWRAVQDGALLSIVMDSSSHSAANPLSFAQDLALYSCLQPV